MSCLLLYRLITSRVEVNILRSINPHFAKVKVSLCLSSYSVRDVSHSTYYTLHISHITHSTHFQDTIVKQNLIRTIDLIGRALHPDHLKNKDFVFSKRGDLINHLLGYIRAEPINTPMATETRTLAIKGLATLTYVSDTCIHYWHTF